MPAVMGDLTTAEVLSVFYVLWCLFSLENVYFHLFAGTAGLDPVCLLMLLSKGSATNLFQALTNLAM